MTRNNSKIFRFNFCVNLFTQSINVTIEKLSVVLSKLRQIYYKRISLKVQTQLWKMDLSVHRVLERAFSCYINAICYKFVTYSRRIIYLLTAANTSLATGNISPNMQGEKMASFYCWSIAKTVKRKSRREITFITALKYSINWFEIK